MPVASPAAGSTAYVETASCFDVRRAEPPMLASRVPSSKICEAARRPRVSRGSRFAAAVAVTTLLS